MGKPIRVTDQILSDSLDNFRKKLLEMKMFSGKINYTANWDYKDGERAKLFFTKLAGEKQQRLVNDFSSEVGWHGMIRRDPADTHKFIVEDILVFPQVVTGATVTPDQKQYQTWLAALPDEQFNHIRYHGHSHVNMGTTPSGTDDKWQTDILDMLPEGDFYVFMIVNKKSEFNIRIFDMANNILYENTDVDVEFEGGDKLTEFIANAKALVETYTYKPPVTRVGSYVSTTPQTVVSGFNGNNADAAHRQHPYEYDDYGWPGSVYGGGYQK